MFPHVAVLVGDHTRTIPLKLVDKKKRLPTSKTIAKGNLGFHCTSVCSFLLEIFIDKQHKAVGQGAEIKSTQASQLGWFGTVNSNVMQSTM